MKHLHVDTSSDIPVHVQIKEQIKAALALGQLEPGDALPSIREVEAATGIGRMLVRKAYRQLEEAGLVEVAHGRRTLVSQADSHNGALARRAQALAARFSATLEKEGLEPVSFARLFHQTLLAEASAAHALYCVHDSRTLARELSSQAQAVLGIPVQSCSLDQLGKGTVKIPAAGRVLTSYYFLEELQQLLGGAPERVLPVSFDYDPGFVDRLLTLPADTSVRLLFHRVNLKTEGTQAAIEKLLESPQTSHLQVRVVDAESVGEPAELLDGPGGVLLVSNGVWDDWGEFMKDHPERFWRLAVCIDRRSLDAVKGKLGIVM